MEAQPLPPQQQSPPMIMVLARGNPNEPTQPPPTEPIEFKTVSTASPPEEAIRTDVQPTSNDEFMQALLKDIQEKEEQRHADEKKERNALSTALIVILALSLLMAIVALVVWIVKRKKE